MSIKNIKYCNNCGQNNHYYRQCKYPITSYGIICYKYINKELNYLLVRRKDSLSYVELIRGKYNIMNIKYLLKLFTNMTINEKEKIKEKNYDILWLDVHLNNKNLEKNNDYIKGKKKFEQLNKGIKINENIYLNIEYLLNNTRNIYIDPEWFFPKGKRELYEEDIKCANREFMEETNYLYNDYEIIKNIDRFEEEHIGSNNISYKTVYYLAKFLSNDKKAILDKNNKYQKYEIGDIGWFKYNEVLKIFRDYHIEKIELIKSVNNYIINNIIKV